MQDLLDLIIALLLGLAWPRLDEDYYGTIMSKRWPKLVGLNKKLSWTKNARQSIKENWPKIELGLN